MGTIRPDHSTYRLLDYGNQSGFDAIIWAEITCLK